MKAAYFYGPRDVRVADSSDAEPRLGEVLIDVTAVGICGSDLHSYLFGNIGGISAQQPLILGHEAAGVIVAVGPDAPHGIRVGGRVAIDPATPCLMCEFCEKGQHHLCTNLQFMGLFPYHGAMRQRMIHPARSVIPVPDSVSDVGAAMLEPLGVALHGSRLAKIAVGEDVAVVGAGTIGLLLVRLARLAGARHVIAVDKLDWRLDMAANFGADVVINSAKADPIAEVLRLTEKRGVDCAIEAAWVKETAAQCTEMARNGGRVVIVGIPAEDELHLKASTVRRKELTILYSRRMVHTYPASIALAASGQVDVEALASHRFPLDQARQAFEVAGLYQDGVLRAMVMPQAK
jgi:L-iditol 2-dehydrogenase